MQLNYSKLAAIPFRAGSETRHRGLLTTNRFRGLWACGCPNLRILSQNPHQSLALWFTDRTSDDNATSPSISLSQGQSTDSKTSSNCLLPQDYHSCSPKSALQKKWFLIKILFSSSTREEEGLISFSQNSGREKVRKRQVS